MNDDNSVRILSLGFALPEPSYTQEEALAFLGYEKERSRNIFLNTKIDKRHIWIAPDVLKDMSWQRSREEYKVGALSLSCEAIERALDSDFHDQISKLIFCSVTGSFEAPELAYPIAGYLRMSENLELTNIIGQGCQSAVPGLREAWRFVRDTGAYALVVNTEICSSCMFPGPETDLENVVTNALFADASSVALVGPSDDPQYPRIVDFESYYAAEYMNLLGFKWVDGRLKCLLDWRVPKVMPILAKITVDRLLWRNQLQKGQISHWIVHPGGTRVLENIEKELGLTREQTQHSWDVMRDVGNVSSATLGIIGKLTQQENNPQGYGIALTMGAGGSVEAALLQWG